MATQKTGSTLYQGKCVTLAFGGFAAATASDLRHGLIRRLLRSTTLDDHQLRVAVDAAMALFEPVLEDKDATIARLAGDA